MKSTPLRVLLIEDDEDDFVLVRDLLQEINNQSYYLDWARTYEAALLAMEEDRHDVYLLDYHLDAHSGLELIRKAFERRDCQAPIIFLTGQGDDEVDMEAMRAGAEDYLVKGQVNAALLERSIRHSIARKRSEESLRQSEMKYKKLSQEFDALLNAISDTLILISTDLKVLWTNNGGVYHLDDSVADIRGRHCHDLFYGRSAPCEDCPVTRCFLSGAPETRTSCDSGRFLEKRAFPIKEGNGVGSVILLISDVTEKMKLQAEAMQATHLASLGELAAGVAHEINNPINGIVNYGQILINECHPESQEHDIGKRIVKEGERTANIVKSLLCYARVEGEDKRPARIDAILKESLILTQAQIRKDGISLDTSVPEDLPEIEANFQQIQQVFLNLINNARYAIHEKYPVRHKNKMIEIRGEKMVLDGRVYVKIIFSDRGVGIPAHKLSMLTMPFFSTKPFGKGTGLGLAIAHRIVTDHGGRLAFESVEGEFTRVIVDLPAKECEYAEDSHRR